MPQVPGIDSRLSITLCLIEQNMDGWTKGLSSYKSLMSIMKVTEYSKRWHVAFSSTICVTTLDDPVYFLSFRSLLFWIRPFNMIQMPHSVYLFSQVSYSVEHHTI